MNELKKEPTWYGREAWGAQRVVRTADRLDVGDAEVMQSWEAPLMHYLVDRALELCRASDPRVLEIGWGMGFSGRRLMASTSRYRVIEGHPDIATDARRHGASVLEGFWQDVVETLPDGSEDLIFFDPFPLYQSEAGREYEEFLEVAVRLLDGGGVLTFYSGRATTLNPHELERLLSLFEHVDLSLVRGLRPPQPSQYYRHSSMVAPVCIKAGRRATP